MSQLIAMRMYHLKKNKGRVNLSAFQVLQVVKFLNGRLKVNYSCQKKLFIQMNQ